MRYMRIGQAPPGQLVMDVKQDQFMLARITELAGQILRARVAAGTDTTMEQVAVDAVELYRQIEHRYVAVRDEE